MASSDVEEGAGAEAPAPGPSAGAGSGRPAAPPPSPEFLAREKRFNDIVALKRPDRVPVVPLCLQYFATRIAGVSNRDAGYDHELMYGCLAEATVRFDWDIAPQTGVLPSPSLEALGATQVRWPGGDLPDDAPFQWVEDEYMKAGEVDAFMEDPDGFTLHTLFPRIASQFEILGELPLPPVWWLANMYFPLAWSPVLSAPPLRALFRALAAVGDDAEAIMIATGGYIGRMAAVGYPDDLRRRRHPALRLRLRLLPRPAWQHDRHVPPAREARSHGRDDPALAHRAGHRRRTGVGYPASLHPDASRRGRLHERRAVRQVLLADVREAHPRPAGRRDHALPLFEGDYTPRLKYLATLPPGRVAAHFDRIDREKFKETCGDVLCFWGDIPGSLLVTGAPSRSRTTSRSSSTSSATPARS